MDGTFTSKNIYKCSVTIVNKNFTHRDTYLNPNVKSGSMTFEESPSFGIFMWNQTFFLTFMDGKYINALSLVNKNLTIVPYKLVWGDLGKYVLGNSCGKFPEK